MPSILFCFTHALDFTLSDLVHRIRARQVRVRGASVATAQQAPGSVPWTARARVGTLARGLPPRRGVRTPRLHALSLSFFGHIQSATFSYRDSVLAYSHYHCATFRSTARCPRSCVRAPPHPSCAATATAAAAMCSPLWLLIDRARFGRRAAPHFGGESFFAQHFFVWRLYSKHGAAVRHDAGRGGTF